MSVLMKCGHTANGKDKDGNPVCVICYMIDPGATQVAEEKPSLEGRKSQCPTCKSITDSSYDLPFFEYRPDKEYDVHYDGCNGWD